MLNIKHFIQSILNKKSTPQSLIDLSVDLCKTNTDKKMPNVIIIKHCMDDGCTEPTKRIAGWGSRVPYTGSYMKYGKHYNIYHCDNTSCPKHPNHTE